MKNGRILVVDDEEEMTEACRQILAATGAAVETETDSARALHRLCSERFDVALVDLRMPGMNGVELARAGSASGVAFVLMTAFPSAETVVDSAKLGIEGYVTKPFSADQLIASVTRALIKRRMKSAGAKPPEGARVQNFDGMIGGSPPMQQLFVLIGQLAPADIDVLILGESGVGKELVARSLYQRSARAVQRFVPVDCGSIPGPLLESQLFGHERGAFTGAMSESIGLIEFAQGGILFLDEVCELAPSLQVKLLRALQERQIRRVGGQELVDVSIRIFAATNRDIDAEVTAGRFRNDLFHRLNAIRVEVPPLRDRREDIPPLFEHFLERFAGEAGKSALSVDPEVYGALGRYHWPGNVRELLNAARRAAVVCQGGVVRVGDLPEPIPRDPGASLGDSTFALRRSLKMRDFESDSVRELLKRHRGDVEAAVRESGVSRATFYRMMRRHGIKAEQFG